MLLGSCVIYKNKFISDFFFAHWSHNLEKILCKTKIQFLKYCLRQLHLQEYVVSITFFAFDTLWYGCSFSLNSHCIWFIFILFWLSQDSLTLLILVTRVVRLKICTYFPEIFVFLPFQPQLHNAKFSIFLIAGTETQLLARLKPTKPTPWW